MSTVLLARDGLVARYLAHELASAGLIDAIVTESGRAARERKLQREAARTPWWRMPVFVFDLAALAVYGSLWSRVLRRKLRGHPAAAGYPAEVERHEVDDANDAGCIAVLRTLRPDVLLVLGTSILKTEVLSLPERAALNVHGGIVPAYRNVHSEVWAVLNDDTSRIGTSILHLDEGIDSGAVALQDTVQPGQGKGGHDSFFELRWRNVELSVRLARKALELEREGALPKTPQPAEGTSGFYRTPGVTELLRLAYRSRRLPASSSSRS